MRLVAARARRAPGLHAGWRELAGFRSLRRLRRALAGYAPGGPQPHATAACAAVLACIRELDPALRGA
jgi:hypothetical protein